MANKELNDFIEFKEKLNCFRQEIAMLKKYTGYIRKNYDPLTIIREMEEKGFDNFTSEGVHKLLFYNLDGTTTWDWIESILCEKEEQILLQIANTNRHKSTGLLEVIPFSIKKFYSEWLPENDEWKYDSVNDLWRRDGYKSRTTDELYLYSQNKTNN